ncbi:hypothetical protein [Streptomyces roseifaciens]|uniref:hypothetical protein n=1 Tax=Streptomyces roseifaciens TaxID=1488406 RepID=UPI0007182133|nr:hypothetical protein [Streptomyces roseifaciens]
MEVEQDGNKRTTCTDVRFHKNRQAVVMCGWTKAVVDLRLTDSVGSLAGRQVRWSVRERNNEHAAELIPGPYMVSADSGHRTRGLTVRKLLPDGSAEVVQQCSLASGHALKWDGKRNLLWALGASVWPASWEYLDKKAKKDPYLTCEEQEHAYGVLCAYPLRPDAARPLGHPMVFPLPDSLELPGFDDPAHANFGWREGPHDFAPIPGQGKLLVTTDLRCFLFDIDKAMALGAASKKEMERLFEPAEKNLLEGFRSPKGMHELKAVSVHSNGDVLICQARMNPSGERDDGGPPYSSSWLTVFRPSTKKHYYLKLRSYTYKARWNEETPGWEGIPLPVPDPKAGA